MTRYPIVYAGLTHRLWRLEEFSAAAGLHPELVRRFAALGLLVAERDDAGELWFDRAQLARVGRIQRLRAGLGLNYAALGLVLDLLARIEELETALRTARRGGQLPHHDIYTDIDVAGINVADINVETTTRTGTSRRG